MFIEIKTGEKIKVEVADVRHYHDARSLLETEGTAGTLSSGADLEQGVKNINNISGYKENIKKFGVYAIEIKFYK